MKVIAYALIIAALLLGWSHFAQQPQRQTAPVSAEQVQSPHRIHDFHEAKRLADQLFSDHRETFYCACRYDKQHHVDADSCGYVVRKNAQRGERIEWEHIVPAHAFGGMRTCWRTELCQKEGKSYKGRKCCEEQDPLFNAMEGDLHNLVPAVGELNADRGNRPFGLVSGKGGEYGACDFKVDFQRDIVQPRAVIRGDIARTYFYFEKVYQLPLSTAQRQLFERWDQEDPVDEWERERNRRIKKLQGNGNPFVESSARPL
jgi:deoxyribonuclease-1